MASFLKIFRLKLFLISLDPGYVSCSSVVLITQVVSGESANCSFISIFLLTPFHNPRVLLARQIADLQVSHLSLKVNLSL